MRTMTAICALLALTGCKVDYTGEGSIRAALLAADGKAATMTSVIGIEAGNTNGCKSDAPALESALAKAYPGAKFVGCTQKDFDVMAEFRVMLPVRKMARGEKSDVPLTVAIDTTDDLIVVGLYLDGAAVNSMMDSMPAEVTTLFDGTFDATVTIDIRNDTDSDVTVETNTAFVDGKPAPYRQAHDLPVGATLRVNPSDVHRAALAENGTLLFAIQRPK